MVVERENRLLLRLESEWAKSPVVLLNPAGRIAAS